jgi:hypothetical protein
MKMYIDDTECPIINTEGSTVDYDCFGAIGSTITLSSKYDDVPVNFCGVNVYGRD